MSRTLPTSIRSTAGATTACLVLVVCGFGNPSLASNSSRDDVVYTGSGKSVHLSTVDSGLKATNKSFRAFVTAGLKRRWKQEAGGQPECKQDPIVQVKRWNPHFAKITNVAWRETTCSGGGYFATYVKVGSKWRAPQSLAGQEAVQCDSLLAFDVPREFSFDFCYPRNGQQSIAYAPGTPVFAADLAVSGLVGAVNASSPAAPWAEPAVEGQMSGEVTQNTGLWQEPTNGCFANGDPSRAGSQESAALGTAPVGCTVTVGYYDNGPPPEAPVYAESWLLRMAPSADGRWRAQSMEFIGGT